ncbi:peptidase inhibitor 16-like [Daphnia carinata]|uniref:peptidase inhibitor 16-like n=1 Tax=Daphnia carinata TaxID=120202 RepID=UPI00257A0AE2|nr:peptidase inhibitor 16-like [Daphnia carinata]
MMIAHSFVAFLAALIISCRAQDHSPYCRLSSQHTMCRFLSDGAKCDGTVSTRGLDRNNRQMILQTHNTLRSIVASGQESRGQPGPQPQASNMQMMMWDEELAAVAQRHAEQCLFEHDCNECRKVARFPVGQNLAVEWTNGPRLPINWKKQVTRWYEEVAEFPNTSARKFEFSVVTGHYSQIIWADTNRVGCGFTSFRDNGTFETNLYVCNYGPAGNFVGLPSYKIGTPCSQCPATTACSTRFPNLCESTKKNPESSVESPAEELFNEILPRPTSKPIRPPLKVTTSSGSVVQRPTQAMVAALVTQRPAVNKPVIVTQRPTVTMPVIVTQSPVMQKPIAATPGTITKPTSQQLSLPALANNASVATVEKDFVCQVGRGACRAVFKGTAWSFRPQTSSANQIGYLETRVAVGQLTELQINQSFPAPVKNTHVCLSFQMKQRVEIDEDEEETSLVIPPLLIKIQPEKSQSVVVPISSGVQSKWIQVKLAASRIRTPFKLHFQQAGPRSEDDPVLSSRTNLQLVFGELRILNGNCIP